MNRKPIHHCLRHPLVLFGATAVVLLGLLIWLIWHILQQDRALVDQRIQERLDNVADLVVAALHDPYSHVERQLSALAASPDANLVNSLGLDRGDEVLLAVVEPGWLQAYPRENLRYYPVLPVSVEADENVFATGEQAEFRNRDYLSASAIYERLAESPNDVIRTGALVRLGRALRKANDPNAALDVYGRLMDSGAGSVGGLPVELLARHARCVLLDELQRVAQLRKEARLLWSDLQQTRWALRRSAYHFYEKEVQGWLGSDPVMSEVGPLAADETLALAAAVEELWRLWERVQQGEMEPSGQRSLRIDDFPVFLMWRGTSERLAALVAGPGYLEKAWLAPAVQHITEQRSVRLGLADDKGHAFWGMWSPNCRHQALRSAAQTQLPWTLQVTPLDPGMFTAELKGRRRLFWGGLALTGALIGAAGYAIVRAVTRELRVACLQGDFVSAVSHEFRTPLASMCHLSELLAEGRVPTEQRHQDYYHALQRESERLHRLVETILDFRRMDVGAHEYQLEPLNTTAFIQGVAHEFAQEVRDRGYTVEIQVETSLPPIQADREALGRAIWNLLDNAVKYSPDCKTVWMETHCVGDRITIEVRDRGLGIAHNEQKNIFDKFYRAEGAKAAGVRGTGLGLTMVRHIVTAHGGQLRLDSRPGAGSTFTIHLPFERLKP